MDQDARGARSAGDRLVGARAGRVAEPHFNMWHDPSDTLEQQTAETLGQSGLIAEALIRQLLSMQSLPQESGPYLYFDESGQVLRGAPLWAIFMAFAAIFGAASWLTGRRPPREMVRGWRAALPHFLACGCRLCCPSCCCTDGGRTHGQVPPVSRHQQRSAAIQPRWPAVIIFIVGLALIVLGRRLAGGQAAKRRPETQEPGHAGHFLGGLYICRSTRSGSSSCCRCSGC
jgi:hypothetical protein